MYYYVLKDLPAFKPKAFLFITIHTLAVTQYRFVQVAVNDLTQSLFSLDHVINSKYKYI
jgi:hypothetical protein